MNEDERVDAVRSFNRFYTRQIGLLQNGYLNSSFSLTEVRVLYELSNRRQTTAGDIARELDIDAGYLSRLLLRLQKRGYLRKAPSEQDGRQTLLSLTKKGQKDFAVLNASSQDQVAAMLKKLPDAGQSRLVESMNTIARLLNGRKEPEASRAPYLLRPHQPGDMGWVIHRHGVLYAQEYGWDERFEALVRRSRRSSFSGSILTRTLLDRRTRRRDRGLGVPG